LVGEIVFAATQLQTVWHGWLSLRL